VLVPLPTVDWHPHAYKFCDASWRGAVACQLPLATMGFPLLNVGFAYMARAKNHAWRPDRSPVSLTHVPSPALAHDPHARAECLWYLRQLSCENFKFRVARQDRPSANSESLSCRPVSQADAPTRFPRALLEKSHLIFAFCHKIEPKSYLPPSLPPAAAHPSECTEAVTRPHLRRNVENLVS
jgi:hypothetical protein